MFVFALMKVSAVFLADCFETLHWTCRQTHTLLKVPQVEISVKTAGTDLYILIKCFHKKRHVSALSHISFKHTHSTVLVSIFNIWRSRPPDVKLISPVQERTTLCLTKSLKN